MCGMKSRFVLTTSILVNRKSLPIGQDTSLIEISTYGFNIIFAILI